MIALLGFMTKGFTSRSYVQTQQIGAEFSRSLKQGSVVCLYGDLGSGKTTFTQGLAKGLGIKNRIISPSFIIVRKYGLEVKGQKSKVKSFYHVDLYRVESEKDLRSLGLDEILGDKGSVVVIEWAEKLARLPAPDRRDGGQGKFLPKERIDVKFEYLDEDGRKITISQKSKVKSQKLNSKSKIPEAQINKAVEVLNSGGIVIFPTDTAFGIGCRIDDEKAVKRVFEIKKRDYSKPLLALVDSMEMAREYVSILEGVKQKLLDKYWPGGLTVFLKCNLEKVPSVVRSGTESLAVRLPDHDEIRNIISQVGVPILATSANISGEKTPYLLSEVSNELISKVDFVLEGECTLKKQSTIIDCTANPWKIVRKGAVEV